jgi:N-acetyl-anhydromuramyl-L-alanine amidase AmpD
VADFAVLFGELRLQMIFNGFVIKWGKALAVDHINRSITNGKTNVLKFTAFSCSLSRAIVAAIVGTLVSASDAAEPKEPDWVQWTASPNHSKRRTAEISAIIYHYTAGGSQSDTVKYFQDPASKVSAHYVLGRDGKVVQMVPLNRAAWHAGESKLAGAAGVNSFSIGIEICNWGKLTKKDDKFYVWSGAPYRGPAPVRAAGAYWEPYTDEQYKSLARLTNALLAKYSIKHITGHSDIALPKGRKTDPGAAFDYQRIKQLLPKSYAGQIGPL